MKEALVEEEGLNSQGGSVWIGGDGSPHAVAIPFGGALRGSEA